MTHFIQVGNEQIAIQIDGTGLSDPTDLTVLWLNGLKSDMLGDKATTVARWCAERNLRSVRMDYSGHGQSSGEFTAGTQSLWLEQVEAVIAHCATNSNRLIICGSSMGGWLALLMARRWFSEQRSSRLSGLVLIAPAFNMSSLCLQPMLNEDDIEQMQKCGQVTLDSDYDEPGYIITRDMLEGGLDLEIGPEGMNLACPVRILHGLADDVVDVSTVLTCLQRCNSDDANLVVVRDGDHRLSRPSDIALLIRTLSEIA